jgi:diketogulonate reductase-like aldo/keto reductase
VTRLDLPPLGLGTSQVQHCAQIVAHALGVGYRHIDTARKYGNERAVGEGIRASGVPRGEIYVTTKVSHERLRAHDVAQSLDESLAELRLDYVDLLLVHWPSPDGVPLEETLAAMAVARRAGLARAIGVANFNIALLEEAVQVSPEPLAALQAEYHPYLDQSKLLAAVRRLGLAFIAYCPLARGRLLGDPVLEEMAKAKGRSLAQLAIRWLLQQGVATIPRSSSAERVAQNFRVFDFELTTEEMRRIHALRRPDGRVAKPAMAPAWD